MKKQEFWPLTIENNVVVCVAADVNLMTSYVLLEQEDWFEDEMDFIRTYIQPDMNCLDIGANHGVYTLTIAKQLVQGRVWAFEPTSAPAKMLERSIDINRFAEKVTLLKRGLSDVARQAEISISANSELNSLSAGGSDKEIIQLNTLDDSLAEYAPGVTIDFVKMDAEGEEINVLKGGQRFFSAQSPLLMFELKHGSSINYGLIEAVKQNGFEIYCLIPAINVLVEFDENQHSDALNLFACKQDRADILRNRGLLVTRQQFALAMASVTIDPSSLNRLAQSDFFKSCSDSAIPAAQAEQYRHLLQICADFEWGNHSPAEKLGLLYLAKAIAEQYATMDLAAEPGKAAWMMMLLFVQHRLGLRAAAISSAATLILNTEALNQFNAHFLPPLDADLSRPVQTSLAHWLQCVLVEFYEAKRSFSSYFLADPLSILDLIKENANLSVGMARRFALACMRLQKDVPENIGNFIMRNNPNNQAVWKDLLGGTAAFNLIDDLLKNDRAPLTINIADIGASSHGQLTEPYAPLMQAGVASVVGFEPDPHAHKQLCDMYGENAAYRYLPYFVGKGGDATFYETNWFMTGSLYKPNKPLLDAFFQLSDVVQCIAEHPVTTVRLDDIDDLGNVDLIKIDVQGGELDVFMGGKQVLSKALAIWTEVEFVELYQGQPLFAEVDQFLRSQGFMFHCFTGIVPRSFKPLILKDNPYAGIKQAIWSDAIYIRDFQKLHDLDTTQLRKLAVILDSVVHSPDFCLMVLKEIDRRENMQLAEAYLKTLPEHFGLIDATAMDGNSPISAADAATIHQKTLQALEFQNANNMLEASRLFQEILAMQPGNFSALYSMAVIASQNEAHGEALQWIQRAIATGQNYAPAYFVEAVELQALGRFDESLASYQRAISIDPAYESAMINRSNLYYETKQHIKALESFAEAIQVNPLSDKALAGQGIILTEMNRYEDAIPIFERLLAANPDFDYGRGLLFHAEQHCCDWKRFEESRTLIEAGIKAGQRVCKTLPFMSLSNSPEDLLKCVTIFADHLFPAKTKLLWQGEVYKHDKIRLAYISPDFREHPVGHLMAGIIEHHDKSKFETIGISLGIDDNSSLRSRFKNAFDQFIDVRTRKSWDIAELIRSLEVDILVDLAGYTADSRTDVLAYRPAPIQVNFLGYPGSLGVSYMDYILADRVVIPEEHQAFYSEKVAYLPDAYLPTDCNLKISERTPTKAEMGLPESGVVFCSFNHDYKINPPMFDVWMRLLNKVPGSVLWLMKLNEPAQHNLRREAAQRGIDPARLIFATRVPLVEDHLARYRLADMFLDTSPYNAHTTASDCLRVGLPVVTYLGNTFSGRVAASLLQAIGMPELVAHSLEEYEALALSLATDRDRLAEIKGRLLANQATYPLFKTDLFCKNLEQAFSGMLEQNRVAKS
ncbi:FkbM family methyltransferase [Methylomonas sp. SURF-2]|uniref:protein O-GlcNAc transferase n=1 Tax=Methylomonas subterranea TaxID=2952225 RepID=A0ABT1TBK2_9GAMM|nr:FkbM family methyltransferase [Methylomonas sp. SURF-2]MCQ8102831.1 FkbM family methyltransferase [Methylomonas sp. SURF-2]